MANTNAKEKNVKHFPKKEHIQKPIKDAPQTDREKKAARRRSKRKRDNYYEED